MAKEMACNMAAEINPTEEGAVADLDSEPLEINGNKVLNIYQLRPRNQDQGNSRDK